MVGVEKQTIEIKTEDEVKGKLGRTNAETLSDTNTNTFGIFFEKLVKAGIDITNEDTSEFIRLNDGTFVIAQKDDAGNLTEVMKIKSTNEKTTQELVKAFITYIFNHDMNVYYKDVATQIVENAAELELQISYEKELNELREDLVPSAEDLVVLLQEIDEKHAIIEKHLKNFRGKLYVNKEMRINKEIIQAITEGHYKDVNFINEDLKTKTGHDALKSTYDETEGTEYLREYDRIFLQHKIDLVYVGRQYSKILTLVSDPRYMRGETDITDTDIIDLGLFGKEEIHRFAKLLNIDLNIDRQKTEEMMEVAMKTLEDQDFKNLFTHLKGVAEKAIDPVKTPFKAQNIEKVQKLVDMYPFLKDYVKLEEKKNNSFTTGSTTGATQGTIEGGPTVEEGTTTDTHTDTDTTDTTEAGTFAEALGEGGIGGVGEYLLDKTAMSPEQKKTWGSVAKLAVTGGVIFLGWKVVSSAFKMLFKKGREPANLQKNLAWVLGPLGVLFGLHALTGEGPGKLLTGGVATTFLAGLLSGKKKGEKGSAETDESSEENKAYVKGLNGVNALFGGSDLSYGDMQEFLEQDSEGKIKIKEDEYDNLIERYRSKGNTSAVDFLQYMGKYDKANIMDLTLTAMGITREAMESDPTRSFDKKSAENIGKIALLYQFMEEKGYNKINTDTLHLVKEYIAKDGADIDDLEDLEARGDVFEKEADQKLEDIRNKYKTPLNDKILTIANGDDELEEELLKGFSRFYKQRPTQDRKADIIQENGKYYLETYEQKTGINIADKTMIGLDNVDFTGYMELFKAANLTNYVKSICGTKTAIEASPFSISKLGKDIEFNDEEKRSRHFDTEVVSAGYGGSLGKISPKLEEYKDTYTQYLNNWFDTKE